MPKLHKLKHVGLKYIPPKKEPEPDANIMVGALSTGAVQTDNSYKIKGGSVFSGGSSSVSLSNNARIKNPDVINPKIRNRNKDTLVRTIF
jgi:hypothetical protein